MFCLPSFLASAMCPSPFPALAVAVPVLRTVVLAVAADAMTVAQHEALLAAGLRGSRTSGTGDGVDVRRRRGRGARPVALVRGGTRLWRRQVEKASSFPGVVQLDQSAVFVLVAQRLAREEEGIHPICADRKQARIGRALPGRDQLRFAFLPLIGV